MSGIVVEIIRKLRRNMFADKSTLENKSRKKNDDQTNHIYSSFHYNRAHQPIGTYLFIPRKDGTFDYFPKSRNPCIHEIADHYGSKCVKGAWLITQWFHQDLPADGPAIM